MNFRLATTIGVCVLSWNAVHAQDAGTGAASQWPYEYVRGEVIVPCPDDETVNCIWHRLIVDNQSSDTLECRGQVTYDGVNRALAAKAERPMVLLPHTRRAVFADTTVPEVKVAAHNLECTVRHPPDSSKLTPNCKPTILRMPSEATYPASSMQAAEEGPVLLEFSLSNKEGAPTDIQVVGSSLWPKLDESGMKYVSQFVGVTDCKHGRFRVPVSFQIK
jgi:TonB family protein